jgi:O-acetylhomoserine (thiol)-lyase
MLIDEVRSDFRVERHVQNGRKVAEFLREDDRIAWITYAGFAEIPYYDLAQKYLGNKTCSLMAIRLKGGCEAAVKFYDAPKLIKRPVNLGDAKSLSCHHPASTTHRQMSPEEQRHAGVTPKLIRPEHRHRTHRRHRCRSEADPRRHHPGHNEGRL